MVIYLERGANLHMAQLMPLPLTVCCFSKIQIGFTFLYRLTRVDPDKGPLNGCVCCGYIQQICVGPSGITALMLPTCYCALVPAADTNRKAVVTSGTDGRTDP